MEKLPVVFRKFNNGGDIIALFPTVAWDEQYNCASYQHIGQHGAAAYDLVVSHSKLAADSEYKPLLKELKSIGYDNLKVVKKQTPQMRRFLFDSLH